MVHSGAGEEEGRACDPPAEGELCGRLVCQNDNVEVSASDVRCLHPSSQCRFREWCQVMAIARERDKSERGRRP